MHVKLGISTDTVLEGFLYWFLLGGSLLYKLFFSFLNLGYHSKADASTLSVRWCSISAASVSSLVHSI